MQASNLVSELEQAYNVLREGVPELPDVIIVVAPTSTKSGRNSKLGHWYKESWQEVQSSITDGVFEFGDDVEDEMPTFPEKREQRRFHELLISAEGLYRGGEGAFETLVHEAAHALATSRGQKDVTGHQYHNRTFKANAEELGLRVEKVKNRGFAYTDLTDELKERYAHVIRSLEAAVKAIRAPRPVLVKSNQGQIKMSCACGTIIRAGKKVAANARILCEDCNHHFHPVDRVDLQSGSLWQED
jgi:hypothetical protein